MHSVLKMVRWYGIELLTLYKDNLDWLLLKINNHNHVASDTGPKGSNQQEHTLTIRPDQINGFATHRTDLPILSFGIVANKLDRDLEVVTMPDTSHRIFPTTTV